MVKQLSVEFEDDDFAELQAVADDERVTPADLVHRLVKRYVHHREPARKLRQQKRADERAFEQEKLDAYNEWVDREVKAISNLRGLLGIESGAVRHLRRAVETGDASFEKEIAELSQWGAERVQQAAARVRADLHMEEEL